MLVLLGNLGIAAVIVLAIMGPLMVGRALAEREVAPDPDVAAIEAAALRLLAGPGTQVSGE